MDKKEETQVEKNFERLKETYGEDMILVAVYGTLRQGESNHRVLKGNQYRSPILLGTIRSKPEFTMYNLGAFPGIVGGNTGIVLEVYAVPELSVQRRLDNLEGYHGEQYNDPQHPMSNHYNKTMIETPWGNSELYIYNGKPYRDDIITSGDWIKRDKVDNEIPL